MKFNLLDQIGHWNPQLFREIKGRLKIRNILLTCGAFIIGQFLFFMAFVSDMPGQRYSITRKYCRLREQFLPFQDKLNKLYQQGNPSQEMQDEITKLQEKVNVYCPENQINYQLWWQDHYPEMFAWLSVITIFLLLIAGTFLLINDLGREKQRGTLNFIQLSPQSSRNILLGKLLGVPILLYLGILVSIPLNFWLGMSAQVSVIEILSFYTIVIVSCAFYFSAALLISLTTARFNGFQAWLGSGLVFGILWCTNYGLTNTKGFENCLNLLSPSVILPFLLHDTVANKNYLPFEQDYIQDWQWFFTPIGQMGIAFTAIILLNYALWTYWIWQGLLRRFRNPNQTLLSKGQSYGLTLCFNLFLLGFLLQDLIFAQDYRITDGLGLLSCFNLLLILMYIALLSPERQTLMDWARYRHENTQKKSLFKDLLWGEKSPSVGAIAFNLFLITNLLLGINFVWIDNEKHLWIFGILFGASLLFMYASIAQIMLMMKSKRRSLWAISTLLALQILPPLTLAILQIDSYENPIPWLFSTFPWSAIDSVENFQLGLTLFGQLLVVTGLNFYLTRKLRLAGESELKALMSKQN